MSEISRDPEELVRQAMSEHHYPDGFVLFLGTLFAPTEDRDEPGRGFTHKIGDEVRISTPKLGTLANRVSTSRDAPAWNFGTRALMRNLTERGLLMSSGR
jgi:fumarylacetoacetate (FAA) hydrolase family protein